MPMRRAVLVASDGEAYDMSHRVLQWPTIRQRANRFQAAKLTLKIAATDDPAEDLSYLRMRFDSDSMMVAFQEGTKLTLDMGYVHPDSGPELINMFTGRIEALKWRKGTIGITCRGADMPLEDMQLGNEVVPLEVGSILNSGTWMSASSIAWRACVEAGLDTTTDGTNEDINWDKFNTWAGTFSDYTTYFQKYSCCAAFTGQKTGAILAEIARQTHSIIGIDSVGKLVVSRRNAANTAGNPVFGLNHILDVEYLVDRHNTVSHITMHTQYQPDSGYWGGAPIDNYNAAIGAIYGYRHETWKSPRFWFHVDCAMQFQGYQLLGYSSSSIPAEQKRYFGQALLTLPFLGSYLEITDSLRIVDSWANVDSATEWYITERATSMEKGTVKFRIQERQIVCDPW
jgi:hypothetical protein